MFIKTVYLKKDEVNLRVSHSIYQYWNKPNERNEQINMVQSVNHFAHNILNYYERQVHFVNLHHCIV